MTSFQSIAFSSRPSLLNIPKGQFKIVRLGPRLYFILVSRIIAAWCCNTHSVIHGVYAEAYMPEVFVRCDPTVSSFFHRSYRLSINLLQPSILQYDQYYCLNNCLVIFGFSAKLKYINLHLFLRHAVECIRCFSICVGPFAFEKATISL